MKPDKGSSGSFLDRLNSVRKCFIFDFPRLSFESVIMPIFLIISRHSPENCPLNNEKMKAMTLELPDKLGGLEKKHGVRGLESGL